MSKLSVLFYVFSLVVLVLFGVFSYLMSTVNPEPILPKSKSHEPNVPDPPLDQDETNPDPPPELPAPPPAPPGNRKMMGTKLPDRDSTASPDQVSITITAGDRNPIIPTEPSKRSKERRSVNDMWKNHDKGIVIMKIFGDDEKPRIEIVFHPKQSRDIRWKNNIKTNKYPKHKDARRRTAEFIYNSVLNVMPDDTVIIEDADYSLNRGLGMYTKIPENTEITEITRNNFVSKNIRVDSLKTRKHDQQTNIQSPVRNISTITVEIESRKSNNTDRKSNNTESTQAALDFKGFFTATVKTKDDNSSSQGGSEYFTENTTKQLTITHSMSYINESEGLSVQNVNNIVANNTTPENVANRENVDVITVEYLTSTIVTENSEDVINVENVTSTKVTENSEDVINVENVMSTEVTESTFTLAIEQTFPQVTRMENPTFGPDEDVNNLTSYLGINRTLPTVTVENSTSRPGIDFTTSYNIQTDSTITLSTVENDSGPTNETFSNVRSSEADIITTSTDKIGIVAADPTLHENQYAEIEE